MTFDCLGEMDETYSISLGDYSIYRTAYNTNPPQPVKPAIQLEGKMTIMSFELIERGLETTIPKIMFNQTVVKDGPWAIISLTSDITCYSFLYLDNEAMTGHYRFELPIMVLEFGTETRDHSIILLVLGQEGDLCEQVGMVNGFELMKLNKTRYDL